MFRVARGTLLRQAVEGWSRKVFYFLLKIVLHNSPLEKKVDQKELRSILIIPYGDAIGDLIAASPLWRVIKRRVSDCKIGVLTSDRNESLLRADPDVDVQYKFAGRRDIKNWGSLRIARKEGYQIVLNLHFTHQTDYGFFANYLSPKAIKITGAHPRRDLYSIFFNLIGHRERHTTSLPQLSTELLSEAVEFEPALHLSEAWPSIVIPDDAQRAVDGAIGSVSDFIIIHQQAATPFREWGIPNSIELAKLLVNRYPSFSVFLTASPAMQESLKEAVRGANDSRIRVYPSSKDLLQFAAFIQRARLVISPETAVPHIASATRTPVLVLLPDGEKLPVEWLPVGTPSRLLAPHVRGAAVKTIPVSEVWGASISLLDGSWNMSQTSLNVGGLQHPMFQRPNGNKLLQEFASDLLSSHE